MPYKDAQAQADYQREWIARQRQDFFHDKVCVKCGSAEALELDHKDRAEKISHRVWSWSPERRAAEIAKCQVLCKVCHLAKTVAERKAPCGTNSAYGAGCRCDMCRAGHRAHIYAWRAKTGRH